MNCININTGKEEPLHETKATHMTIVFDSFTNERVIVVGTRYMIKKYLTDIEKIHKNYGMCTVKKYMFNEYS